MTYKRIVITEFGAPDVLEVIEERDTSRTKSRRGTRAGISY